MMIGCAPRIPSLPRVVQNHIVPQAFEWQHKDISKVEFKETTDIESHRHRSTKELFNLVKAKLDQLDYRPRNYSGIKATLIMSVPEKDLDRRDRDQSRKTAGNWGRFERVTPDFKPVWIPVETNLNLAGLLAVHDQTHPYVILLPGTFDGRDGLYVRDTALLCYRHGYNVLVIEMRNHGQSIEHWISIGWKEGRDVLAAAKWLKMKGGDRIAGEQLSVAVIGFSLGAWYGIRAAYDASVTSQEHLLNGGVIAFNPPVNIKETLLDWNRKEFRGCELTLRSQVFKQFDSYLRKRIKELGKETEFKATGETFDVYVELAANAQQLSREEVYQRAVLSPEQITEKVRVPIVVYHAEDDPLVDVKHSQNLKRAIEMNDSGYIKVIIKKKGGHIALHEVEPQYYVNLILTVLEGLKR